jgi:hypothetical protein
MLQAPCKRAYTAWANYVADNDWTQSPRGLIFRRQVGPRMALLKIYSIAGKSGVYLITMIISTYSAHFEGTGLEEATSVVCCR